MASGPDNKDESFALRLLRKVAAATTETTSAEELRRAREGLPPATNSAFASTLTYVAIERAIVLGNAPSVIGNVYVLEADGRLKPVSGHDLVELNKAYPNFVRRWRTPASD